MKFNIMESELKNFRIRENISILSIFSSTILFPSASASLGMRSTGRNTKSEKLKLTTPAAQEHSITGSDGNVVSRQYNGKKNLSYEVNSEIYPVSAITTMNLTI